jgi:urease accessory protein
MLRAVAIVRRAVVRADRVVDTVTLDHEGRNRRRIALRGDAGLEFLLDLDHAAVLLDGDALELEDGRLVQVKAAPQRLLEVRADGPQHLVRVAYHVGNRHAPAEVAADALFIVDDQVLAEMVRAQGCTATPLVRPFQPESGAYQREGLHTHGHAHAPYPPHGPVHPHGNHPGANPGTEEEGPDSNTQVHGF